jgi:two-component system chemotaxis sensor kinase CheA
MSRAGILSQVRVLIGGGHGGQEKGGAAQSKSGTAATSSRATMRSWAIRFAPGPEFLLHGANPLLLLAELRTLGGLSVTASMEMLPPLAEAAA